MQSTMSNRKYYNPLGLSIRLPKALEMHCTSNTILGRNLAITESIDLFDLASTNNFIVKVHINCQPWQRVVY